MPIPREAISLEDYERKERGLAPRKQKKQARPEPEEPVVENRIRFSDIPPGEVLDDLGKHPSNKSNKDGVRFIGYDVYLRFRSGKTLEGWMGESDWMKVVRVIPSERTDLRDKATK